MRSWIPVPGTVSEKLARAALEQFGERGFAAVGVGSLAAAAGVTTGSLYHHFESKAGLYRLVRGDVERRALDRMEGAAAVTRIDSIADASPAVLVGFDYLVGARFARLLGETAPPDAAGGRDRVEEFFAQVLDDPAAAVSVPLAAAWRACLWQAAAGAAEASRARAGLARLMTGGRSLG